MKRPHRSSTIFAWCIYHDGDMCINPKSPVNTASERRELLGIILNPVTAVFGDASSARYFKGGMRADVHREGQVPTTT